MKLYYAPGACSISPHIALAESGLPYTLERVDFKAGKKLPDGTPFATINPKGYVPALRLDDGQLLTEGSAIVQYIADRRPEAELAPPAGTFERVRLQEWLNFIATEVHKGLVPLFGNPSADYKQAAKDKLFGRLQFVAEALAGKSFLLGDRFSVADGYMFYSMRAWRHFVKAELPDGLHAYNERIIARAGVRRALEEEGAG